MKQTGISSPDLYLYIITLQYGLSCFPFDSFVVTLRSPQCLPISVSKSTGIMLGRELFFLFLFPLSSPKNTIFPLSFQPATSLEIQILLHPPTTRGVLVECNSAGWFPQPQMEWRDSRGEIIPHASKSHSQDTGKLFHMKMTLLLKKSSQGNVTCYLRNPVTGQEERTNIVLSGEICVFVLQMLAVVIKYKLRRKINILSSLGF